MKKKSFLYASAFLAGTVWMASCGSDDVHQLGVMYPNGIHALYADDTEDSISFVTFDSWSVIPVAPWITVNGNASGTIKHDNNARYRISVPLNIGRNTTGRSRWGLVNVKSYEYMVNGLYYQMGTLNINHPAYQVKSYIAGTNDQLIDSVAYELRDSAFVTDDSICFTVKQPWMLAFKGERPSWVSLSSEEGFGGHANVAVTMEENTDTEDRIATVVLTSSGVSNEIDIRQYGVKKPVKE